jgi:hypothetical protein
VGKVDDPAPGPDQGRTFHSGVDSIGAYLIVEPATSHSGEREESGLLSCHFERRGKSWELPVTSHSAKRKEFGFASPAALYIQIRGKSRELRLPAT